MIYSVDGFFWSDRESLLNQILIKARRNQFQNFVKNVQISLLVIGIEIDGLVLGHLDGFDKSGRVIQILSNDGIVIKT